MEILKKIFRKSKPKDTEPKDTGLRGTVEGKLYVDKKVFYNRPEVRKVVLALKESNIVKEHIEVSKAKGI